MKEGQVGSGRNIFSNYGQKNNLADLSDKSAAEIIKYFRSEVGPVKTDSIINVVKSNQRLIKDSVELANLIGDQMRIKISNEDFLNLNPNSIADKYQIEGYFKRLHFKQRIRLQKSGKNLLPFVIGNSFWVLMLMMPFLALILKLLYIRHDYYYVEHLIFSFHVHSFAFILFTGICIFMNLVFFHPLIVFFGLFLIFIYLYNAIRRVYQQNRWKTVLKLLFTNVIYLCLFFGFAILGILVSIFLF